MKLPLALLLLALPMSSHAQAKGKKCRTYAKAHAEPGKGTLDEIKSRLASSNAALSSVEIEYRDPAGDTDTGQEIASAHAARTKRNPKDHGVIVAGPRIFTLAGNDANKVACVIGHELQHLAAEHEKVRKPIFERKWQEWQQRNPKEQRRRIIADRFGGCSETKKYGNLTECELLEQGIFQDDLNLKDQEYIGLRQGQELEADVEGTQLLAQGGFDPWACWLLHKTMRRPPPDPKVPDFHKSASEIAAAIKPRLDQSKQPCE